MLRGAETSQRFDQQSPCAFNTRHALLSLSRRMQIVQCTYLDAKGEHVAEVQYPCLPGAGGVDQGSGGNRPGLAASLERLKLSFRGVRLILLLLELAEVAIGGVVSEEERQNAEDEEDSGGPRDGEAPGRVVVHSISLARCKHDAVQDVGNTAAKVAPARRRGVGNTDNVEIKHRSCPELREHEGPASEPD